MRSINLINTLGSQITLALVVEYMLVTAIHTQVCNVNVPCDCCNLGESCAIAEDQSCQGPCKDGYWGAKCIRQCPKDCVSCSQTYGKTSECFKCVSGRHGLSCELSCDNCTVCNKTTGVCSACKPGFYGSTCTQNCPTNCKNRLCSMGSGDCIDCVDGYRGNKCLCLNNCERCLDQSVSCTKCKSGYYGDMCNKTCSSNCDKRECDTVTGNCNKCNPGLFGEKCQYHCSLNCVGNACDKTSGNCTECKPGFFGDICQQNCSLNCLEDTCDKTFGVCTECKPGFYGKICLNNCSVNCLGDGNACDKTFGNCTECKPGFYGEFCKHHCSVNCDNGLCNKISGACTECKNGFYGDICNNTCASNCFNKSCDRSSGECDACTAGFFGFNCTNNCSNNCNNDSNDICNKTTGECTSCLNGYFDLYCNKSCPINCNASVCEKHSGECITCSLGFYGNTCNENCSQTCKNDICEKVSGECIECVVGRYGNTCSKICPPNCGGYICNKTTGFCSDGCNHNFNGEKCRDCINGKYGTHCNLSCSEFCNNSVCDRETGICLDGCIIGSTDLQYCCLNNTYCERCSSPSNCTMCTVGNYGEDCELTCPTNCIDECDRESGHCRACKNDQYGRRCESNCSVTCASTEDESRRCSRYNGTCPHGCKNSFYGRTCENACSEQCNGSCNHTTGHCFGCLNNTSGMFCNMTCPSNCFVNETESTQCTQQNGSCSFGCQPGYFGPKCDQTCSVACHSSCSRECIDRCDTIAVCSIQETSSDKEPGSTAVTVPVAVSTVCVCIAVIVVAGFIVARKRRSKTTKDYTVSNNKKTTKSTFAHVYQNTLFNGQTNNPDDDEESIVDLPSVQEADISLVSTEHTKPIPEISTNRRENVWQALSKPEDILKQEFLKLPKGLILPYDESRKPENKSKNRYNMIYPYNTTRVKIADETSDYINASYIDGCEKPNAYIAALGPTTKTLGDNFYMFWKMIWQEKVETIVMLTNLVEITGMKCDQYWPNHDTTVCYGDISVNCVSEETYAEFVVRNMTVSKNSEQRQLHHAHFTAWPDKGVPSDVISINNLRHKVVKMRKIYDGPLLVHCSAGIGRTGTYIALDILSETGASGCVIDVFDCVNNMRQQRVNMVQTPDQYKYLHNALLWSLTSDKEPFRAERFTDLTWLYSEQTLKEMLEQLHAEVFYDSEEVRAAIAENKAESFANRNGADIPGARHTVFLSTMEASGIERSAYINAVYIDGYKRQNRFIAAQTPLPETVTQFLNMILKEKVTCIVELTSRESSEDVGEYLPSDGQELQHESYVFKITSQEDKGIYTKQEITISEHGQIVQTIYHFKFHDWDDSSTVPESLEEFLQFLNDVEKLVIAKEISGPIIVHCLTGAVKSGLFCAVWVLIEKIRVDFKASVLNTLGQIKARRRMAVPDEVQIAFCFESVSSHLSTPDQRVYSNMVLNVL